MCAFNPRKRKHKKIYYVPGMISLLFLAILCMVFFEKHDVFRHYGALELGLPDTRNDNRKFCIDTFGTFPIPRKYTDFNYNKSAEAEHAKLKSMQLLLRKMKSEKDTVRGVKIHFGKTTTYQVYIDVLDILTVEHMPLWFGDRDDFYVVIMPPYKPKKEAKQKTLRMNCGTPALMAQKFADEQAQIEKQRAQDQRLAYYKSCWMIGAGFIGLMGLNGFFLFRFHKKRFARN